MILLPRLLSQLHHNFKWNLNICFLTYCKINFRHCISHRYVCKFCGLRGAAQRCRWLYFTDRRRIKICHSGEFLWDLICRFHRQKSLGFVGFVHGRVWTSMVSEKYVSLISSVFSCVLIGRKLMPESCQLDLISSLQGVSQERQLITKVFVGVIWDGRSPARVLSTLWRCAQISWSCLYCCLSWGVHWNPKWQHAIVIDVYKPFVSSLLFLPEWGVGALTVFLVQSPPTSPLSWPN